AMRPLRMARHLCLLPRRQAAVEFLQCGRRLDLNAVDFLANGDGIAARLHGAQFLDLGLELGHRLFEVEIATHHSKPTRTASSKGMRLTRQSNAPKSSKRPSMPLWFSVSRAPAGADRAPGFSGALPARGCRSAWSRCRRGRAASAPRG